MDYLDTLNRELDDLELITESTNFMESTSPLIARIDTFYNNVIRRVINKGTDLGNEIVKDLNDKDNRDVSSKDNPYINHINNMEAYLYTLKSQRYTTVEIYNYVSAFEVYRAKSNALMSYVSFFLNMRKDETTDIDRNVKEFDKLYTSIKNDLNNMKNRSQVLNIDTVIRMLEDSKTRRKDIIVVYKALYDNIKRLRDEAYEIEKRNDFKVDKKNSIVSAYNHMCTKIVSFTSDWTFFFKSNYPLSIVKK